MGLIYDENDSMHDYIWKPLIITVSISIIVFLFVCFLDKFV